MDPAAAGATRRPLGMPAGRKLPAVTKNRNYPQPVKYLKPMALSQTCSTLICSTLIGVPVTIEP